MTAVIFHFLFLFLCILIIAIIRLYYSFSLCIVPFSFTFSVSFSAFSFFMPFSSNFWTHLPNSFSFHIFVSSPFHFPHFFTFSCYPCGNIIFYLLLCFIFLTISARSVLLCCLHASVLSQWIIAKGRYPLPTTRVHGPCSRAPVHTTREHGLCWRAVVTPVHRHLLTSREHGRVEGPWTLVVCTQQLNGLVINGSVTRGGSMGVRRGRSPPPQTAADQKIETLAWVIKPAFDRPGDARPIKSRFYHPVSYSVPCHFQK